jgi:DNA-binding HxlR family transcriptional regulator
MEPSIRHVRQKQELKRRARVSQTFCLMTSTMAILGGKWKLQVLSHMVHEPIRYGELKRKMPEISEKMLIQALRELEADGIIVRTQYNEIPPRVDYALSEIGRELVPVIKEMMAWGQKYVETIACKLPAQAPDFVLTDKILHQ